MHEQLNQMAFVYAAYAIGVGATAALVALTVSAMRKAEARRERSRER